MRIWATFMPNWANRMKPSRNSRPRSRISGISRFHGPPGRQPQEAMKLTMFAESAGLAIVAALVLTGCQAPCSYTNFREHPPRSILVLPPLNESASVAGPFPVTCPP